MANRYWVCVNFHQRHCNFLDTFILILIPLRSHTHTNALSPSNRLNCCYIARNRVSLRPPASLLFILWPTRKISFCFCDQLIRIKLYDGHKRCENVRMPSLLPLNACWRCQCTRTTNIYIYIFQMSNHPISIYSFLFLFFLVCFSALNFYCRCLTRRNTANAPHSRRVKLNTDEQLFIEVLCQPASNQLPFIYSDRLDRKQSSKSFSCCFLTSKIAGAKWELRPDARTRK